MATREPLIQPWSAFYQVGHHGQECRATGLMVSESKPLLATEIIVAVSGEGRTVYIRMPQEACGRLVERLMLVGGFHIPVEADKENLLTLIDCLREKEAKLMEVWVREGTSTSLDAALERVRRMRLRYEADLKELQS